MTGTLQDMIGDERVHVMDGAMGTILYTRGAFLNVCYDNLCLTHADLVQDVHDRYVRAGAEIIATNTFGANPVKLSGFGLDELTETVNRTAATIARRAAGGKASVVGAIGPLGIPIEPLGPTSREEAYDFFTRQARGLLEGEVDGFVLETFSDLEELHAAFRAVRSLCDLPIISQVTIGEDGKTIFGTDVETIAATTSEWGTDIVGVNCSVGPTAIFEAIQRMAAVTALPLSSQPNAGLPRTVGDRKIYLASPDYMAQYARQMIKSGARFVGGCCGTTPEHVRKIRECVATVQPRSSSVSVHREVLEPTDVKPVPLRERSRLGRRIASGEALRCVEMMAPRGCVAREVIARCRALAESGIDIVNLADDPSSQSRMGSLPLALIVEREGATETIVRYSCRGRNMPGMIGDLLGAAAAGLHNLLIVTGAPPPNSYADTAPDRDIDSIGLTNLAKGLNDGRDPGGNAIGDPTRYVIGVEVNQDALDLERELSRFEWKVEAGADFAVTRPVFDLRHFEAFLKRIEHLRIPIIASVWPVMSLRYTDFLANEVPGMRVPKDVRERMRKAQDAGHEAACSEGVNIARETLETVNGGVQGIQVRAPQGRADVALEVLSECALGSRAHR